MGYNTLENEFIQKNLDEKDELDRMQNELDEYDIREWEKGEKHNEKTRHI